jgi:F0F1-type ATP synthase membrane subunit b/b'
MENQVFTKSQAAVQVALDAIEEETKRLNGLAAQQKALETKVTATQSNLTDLMKRHEQMQRSLAIAQERQRDASTEADRLLWTARREARRQAEKVRDEANHCAQRIVNAVKEASAAAVEKFGGAA